MNRSSSHPLDMIPLFRRWPCSPLRDLLYTGIWNCMLALILVIAGRLFAARTGSFWNDLYPSLVISNIIGYLIHACLYGGNRLLRDWPSRTRSFPKLLYYVIVIGGCVILGIALGTGLLRGVNPMDYLARTPVLAALLPFSLLTALFMVVVLMMGERRIADETLAARQSEQIANAAQLLAEARLRALQTQVEPHFLYNTLANVVGLIDTQPAQARRMLERFIDFLRASLAASRAECATLGAELDLTAAYLDVLAVRMGARLRYHFEVPEDCRSLGMAPMLLQPLVENAVTHGLEPKVEGGAMLIRALRQDARLVVEVSDTGVGLTGAAPKPGGGVGLSNLRARLRSLYDGDAQVQLLENQPCGITVRLVLPLKEPTPSTIHVP